MTSVSQNNLALELATIEPTWRITLRAWWSWQWRVALAAFLLSTFAGFWLGAMGGFAGMSHRDLTILNRISNYLISVIVGLFFFKDVLDREFPRFRVCVVPKEIPQTAQPEATSPSLS